MARSMIKYLLIILVLVVQGCYYDAENDLYPFSNTNCDSVKGTYSTEVLPLMETKCKSCHTGASAGGGILIENYDQTKANAAKILTSINHSTGVSAMPKGEPIMPICEIKKIQKWVDNGTPNN